MNFGELIDRVRTWRASFSGSEDTANLTYIKDTINSVYKEVLSQEDAHWTNKEKVIDIEAQFTDGALYCTVGLSVAFLHSTSTFTGFDYTHWGGKAQIGNSGMYYEVAKTAVGVAGGTNSQHYVYFDRPYQGTTTGSIAYSLYRDSYPLPHDFRKVENVRLGGENGYVLRARDYDLYDNSHVHALVDSPGGDPEQYTIWKRSDTAWFTATCTFTNGSVTVEMAEDNTYYGLEDWKDRCLQDAAGDRYRVRTTLHTGTDDKVLLELDRTYGGTSAVGTVANVDPRGTPMIQFWPPPTSADTVVFKYLSTDYDMVNNSDEPMIPQDNHDVIWKGAVYYIAMFDGEHPLEVMDRLYRDFELAKRRLESYRTFDRDIEIRRRTWGRRTYVQGVNIPYTITV